MDFTWTKKAQKFDLLSAYQDWSRTLLQQDSIDRGDKTQTTFVEQIVLKLIVGEEFQTIEEARLWLLDNVDKGRFLMDGFEREILALRTGKDGFSTKYKEVTLQNMDSNENGEVYTLYRVAVALLDKSSKL